MRQTELLLTECADEVEIVHHLWECQYQSIKKGDAVVLGGPTLMAPFEQLKVCNAELIQFLEGPNFRPFEKLKIRDGLSAALSETFALKYLKQPGETCYILDISSLFSHVAIDFPMPQGRYSNLIGDELASTAVSFDPEGTRMYLNGTEVIAVVQARVFPPRQLVHPFLQTQINGITVATLCRKCSLEAKRRDGIAVCTHSELERSFVSTLSSCEVAYAALLGYTFNFFEMIVYYEAGFFLRPFLTLLAFEKLRHSEYPKNIVTPDEKVKYCKSINEQMQFPKLIQMEFCPAVVQPNAQLRAFSKACLNFFLGTFGANPEKGTTVEFVHYYQELLKHVKSNRIVDLVPLTDDILQVTLKNREVHPSRTSNVSVAISITAMARVVVHKKMQQVTQLGGCLLRVACDALYFVLPDTVPLPFQIDEAFGNFKHQFENVEAVIQVGLRNLSILFRDSEGHLREHLITGGVMLSQYNEAILCHEKYKDVVEKLFQDDPQLAKTKVLNVQYQNSIKRPKLKCVRKKQTAFSQLIHLRRQFMPNSKHYASLPYGFQVTNALLSNRI